MRGSRIEKNAGHQNVDKSIFKHLKAALKLYTIKAGKSDGTVKYIASDKNSKMYSGLTQKCTE